MDSLRNKMVSRSSIKSTCHIQKRIEKVFNLFQYENKIIFQRFKIKKLYYSIEFQARGALHIHLLLWLEDIVTGEAFSSFWNLTEFNKLQEDLQHVSNKTNETEQTQGNMEHKEEKKTYYAAKVVSGSIDEGKCNQHKNVISEETDLQECQKCKTIRERVEFYNAHKCSFTCHKIKKIIFKKKDTTDQVGDVAIEIPKCRFNFPLFSIHQILFIEGRTKENNPQDEEVRKQETSFM